MNRFLYAPREVVMASCIVAAICGAATAGAQARGRADAATNTSSNIPASTPIRFAWPVAPDAKTYGSVETCIGMYDLRWLRMFRQALSDSISEKGEVYSRALPREIADGMRRCAEPFTVDQLASGDRTHINAIVNAFEMLLLAGRSSEAHALVARWLATLRPDGKTPAKGNETEWHEGIGRLFSATLDDMIPTRWDDAWAIVNVYDPKTDGERRFMLGAHVMSSAYYQKKDTAQLHKAARWVVQAAGAMPDSITRSARWRKNRAPTVYQAQKLLLDRPLMDSLARGTSTYIRYLTTLQQTLGISGQETFPKADSVRGEYWFPARPATGRPARGAAPVVIITPDNECGECNMWLPLVRRIHERYPRVELTLLAQTRGHFGVVMEPVGPDVEARLIDSVYRTANRLTATVVVHGTKFVRVEDPDRRRVNLPGPNAKSYNTVCNVHTQEHGTKAYIIDREGVVVDNFCFKEAHAMWRFERLLGPLSQQQ